MAAIAQGLRLGIGWVGDARFGAARTRVEQQLGSGQMQAAFDGAQALHQRALAAGEQACPEADYDLAMACYLLANVLRTSGGAEAALALLDEARQRFEAITKPHAHQAAEGMAAACITAQGNCLADLGRLVEAATAYEEASLRAEQRGRERDVAVGKVQLGTVRLWQQRYPEALAAYSQARERFSTLAEPGSVATAWHQTGMVHQQEGKAEAAEDAYRKSLTINEHLGNVAGQANTWGQLGSLYHTVLGRTEEAVTFFRLALDIYIKSHDVAQEGGGTRNNLALRLHKLHRLDEARQEIRRAIECKAQFGLAAQPWKSWNTLADIEAAANNPAACEAAKANALTCYLAYRRAGGENHYPQGRQSLHVTQALQAGDPSSASALLQQQAAAYATDGYPSFIPALLAIGNGSRDRNLAAAPDLLYSMAAEIHLLIDTVG